jgi:hypothetical protein
MKYFGVSFTDQVGYLLDPAFFAMARSYWGPRPLPSGAEIIGGYRDGHRAGALIRLVNGVWVCGNAGAITTIEQPKPVQLFCAYTHCRQPFIVNFGNPETRCPTCVSHDGRSTKEK